MPADTRADLYRPLPNTDLMLHPLCLGGNVFGFTADEAASFDILDAYFEAGGNVVDTADSYCHWVGSSGGESETIIGRWMAARANRDEMVIATKVGQLPGRDNLRRETIRAAVEGSLRRLGTDHLDLYYAHEDHGDPLEETVEAFDQLVAEGKVRHVAASNFTAPRLVEAMDLAGRAGLSAFAALQPLYNLIQRSSYESELAAVVSERKIGVLPYWGLACGYLTGKYRRQGPRVEGPRSGMVEQFCDERGERILDALDAVSRGRGLIPAPVALAWLASRPGIVAPIASARTPGQLAELLPMAELHLTAEELDLLEAASRRPEGDR